MTLSDGDVQFKLDETLHQPIMSNQTDDLPEVHDSPCLPFICRTNCHYPRMQQLVKDLTWRLEEHKVKPASLLLFTVEHSNYPVLLGVSMKRPMSHIFVNAALDADQVSLTDARGTLPQFQSSHELMLKLLREHSPNPDSTLDVTVDVWGCSAFLDERTNMLKSNPDKWLCVFTISSEKKAKKKPTVVKLPFGFDQRLRDLKKKGKQRGPVQKKQKTKAKAHPKTKASKSSSASKLPESDSEGSLSSSSSESGGSDNAEKEEEQAAPMSSVVATEQRAVQEVAREIEMCDAQRAETADTVRANLSTGSSSSFFSKELGLDSGSMAVSSRAVCLQCKTKINIHTVRYAWFHSKVKPPGWCHAHCLQRLVKETGMREQAMAKLKQIAEQAKPNPHVYSAVAADAQRILHSLESELE